MDESKHVGRETDTNTENWPSAAPAAAPRTRPTAGLPPDESKTPTRRARPRPGSVRIQKPARMDESKHVGRETDTNTERRPSAASAAESRTRPAAGSPPVGPRTSAYQSRPRPGSARIRLTAETAETETVALPAETAETATVGSPAETGETATVGRESVTTCVEPKDDEMDGEVAATESFMSPEPARRPNAQKTVAERTEPLPEVADGDEIATGGFISPEPVDGARDETGETARGLTPERTKKGADLIDPDGGRGGSRPREPPR
ncbi:Hypothetical predicted protein [Paramuricea clavata]|uniref:Uncharacterized protein n=1 Tax=Paramuricea clavata TaxID=317549 RepID=A0A6S7JZ43_PARCT|nr:Hypothetical predicted protein [Paramuricea clavata]